MATAAAMACSARPAPPVGAPAATALAGPSPIFSVPVRPGTLPSAGAEAAIRPTRLRIAKLGLAATVAWILAIVLIGFMCIWPLLTRMAAANDDLGFIRGERNAGTLADDLRYTGRGVTTVEEHDLWHMPIVLMLLVGLLCAEWGYRRAVGYA